MRQRVNLDWLKPESDVRLFLQVLGLLLQLDSWHQSLFTFTSTVLALDRTRCSELKNKPSSETSVLGEGALSLSQLL
jgi:hypothetical protein